MSLGAFLGLMPGMGMNYNRTGVMARPQTFRISVFESPVSHQRWHGVTSWHIYVVVKTLSNLGQALLQTSYKLDPVARTLVVSIGKRVPLWAKR